MKRIFSTLILLIIITGCATSARLNYDLKSTAQNPLLYAQAARHFPTINKKQEQKLKDNYLQHYFSPWEKRPSAMHEPAIKSDEIYLAHYFLDRPGWIAKDDANTHAAIKHLIYEMNLKSFPNLKQKAITVTACSLRLLPTDEPSFENFRRPGQGYPFDNFQVEMLRANLPLYILQTTKNGLWNLVITPDKTFGWIKSSDLAYASNHFRKIWQTKTFVVAKRDHALIFNDKLRVYSQTRIGELFPLTRTDKNNYRILFAGKNSNNVAVIKRANIAKTNAAVFPIKITAINIAIIANNLIGQHYGWGDLYGYRDCSSTLMALFSPFAIWLPKNSSDQAHEGKFISFENYSNQQKQQLIKKHGIPFLTLIWHPGHIMLYIGSIKNQVYIFHNPWGLATTNYLSHKEGRAVIGHAVITPLNFDQSYFNVPVKYLTNTAGMTLLLS